MLSKRNTKEFVSTDDDRPVPASTTRNRRPAIVAALRRCMLAKGYAETNLTELAKAADMSVSHLLYYYSSKELVLNDLCDQVIDRVLEDVTAHRDEPPEERIHVLVDNVFLHGAIRKAELGIVRELIALSMHQPEINAKLNRYSDEMMRYLEDLFSKTPRQPGFSAAEAAEITGALWMGLVNNSGYDGRLDNARARRIFRKMLLFLANIESPSRSRGDAPASAPRQKRSTKAATPKT
jgi:AcrR family transcriptional regulator